MSKKDDNKKDFSFLSEEPDTKEEVTKEPKEKKFPFSSPVTKKKKGIVSTIVKGNRIIVNVNGNGEALVYREKEHAHLKVGDLIEF